jgi:hypothetical protein
MLSWLCVYTYIYTPHYIPITFPLLLLKISSRYRAGWLFHSDCADHGGCDLEPHRCPLPSRLAGSAMGEGAVTDRAIGMRKKAQTY